MTDNIENIAYQSVTLDNENTTALFVEGDDTRVFYDLGALVAAGLENLVHGIHHYGDQMTDADRIYLGALRDLYASLNDQHANLRAERDMDRFANTVSGITDISDLFPDE